MKDKITQLLKERERLREYAKTKIDSDDDYHAVIDACMDIRDIDCKLQVYKEVQKNPTQKDEDWNNGLVFEWE